MTCISAIVDRENERIIIGGDSAGISEYYLTVRSDHKIYYKDGYLIGFCENFRIGQLLAVVPKLPCFEGESVLGFMVAKFIPFIKKVVQEEVNTLENKSWTLLIGFKSTLFVIHNDYQVEVSINNYNSIGCGSDLAKGYMFGKIDSKQNKRKTLIRSLKCAETHSAGVAKPFNVLEMDFKGNLVEP